jgi:hypothetical protein
MYSNDPQAFCYALIMKTHQSHLLFAGCLGAARGNGIDHERGALGDGLVSYWPLEAVQGTKTPDHVSG